MNSDYTYVLFNIIDKTFVPIAFTNIDDAFEARSAKDNMENFYVVVLLNN